MNRFTGVLVKCSRPPIEPSGGYGVGMAKRRKRATIREVAEATGLSAATVSYALRGVHVPVETQNRVRKAADELGYEADPIARALASGRTGMVGVLCASLADLWQRQLATEISGSLLAGDRYALILDSVGDPDREIVLARRLRDQRVDALVVIPIDPANPAWEEVAEAVPLVSIGDALPGPTVGEVLFDDQAGVTTVLDHLHELGHREVVVFTPSRPSTPDRLAERHVISEGRDRGMRVSIHSAPHDLVEATKAARSVLEGPQASDPPTAAFCFSDSIAYGVYAAARELGLPVPGSLSVVGYDDQPVSGLLTPGLTSMDWNGAAVAAAAAELVRLSVDEPTGQRRRLVMSPVLRPRGSSAQAPQPASDQPKLTPAPLAASAPEAPKAPETPKTPKASRDSRVPRASRSAPSRAVSAAEGS